MIASVFSEKTSLKKLMIIIMNKSQETTVFSARQKLTSAMKLRDGRLKILCSIQVSLLREPPEIGLVENVSGSLYCWVELGVPFLHRECYRTL